MTTEQRQIATIEQYSDTEKQIYATFRENKLNVSQSISATSDVMKFMLDQVNDYKSFRDSFKK